MDIILLGDTQVGKTSILNALIKDSFDPYCDITTYYDNKTYRLNATNKSITLNIWDTPGNEKISRY